MKEEKKKISKDNKDIQQIGILTDKIKELEDKLLRNQAELINYKRRKEEEVISLLEYANMGLIKDILPMLDNIERAISMDNDDLTDEVSRFLEGFKIIYEELKNILTNYGVIEIEALNKPFDPNYHEAVMTSYDKDKEIDIILEVLQKGYMLKDRIIRPAVVKVNKEEIKNE